MRESETQNFDSSFLPELRTFSASQLFNFLVLDVLQMSQDFAYIYLRGSNSSNEADLSFLEANLVEEA